MLSTKALMWGLVLWAVATIQPAFSATVTYRLEGVTFTGGGSATGTFDYDTSSSNLQPFSNINIVTSLSPPYGATYSGSPVFSSPSDFSISNDPLLLSLIFESAACLQTATTSCALNLLSAEFDFTNIAVTYRFVTSGSAQVVPIPAGGVLLLSGLVGLSGIRVMRRMTVTAQS